MNWALIITILTNPEKSGKRVSHCVRKFKVPEFILELLEGLPILIGFGIRGDVLAIFSLLAGRPVKLNGFVDLGSLMVFAGWGMRTVNRPSKHAVVCGSVLNKTVSCADKSWGMEWHQLAESLRCAPWIHQTCLVALDDSLKLSTTGSGSVS